MTSALTNSTRDKLLELLGDNIDPKSAAAALGITESMISQYLSDESFASEVMARRYKSLVGNNSRDRAYGALEDRLLERLSKSVDMIFDPLKVAQILSRINAATRRGAQAPTSLQTQTPVVALNIPSFVYNKFITQVNIHNQVVSVADESGKSQSLVTIQSKTLADMIENSTSIPSRNGNQNGISNSPIESRA